MSFTKTDYQKMERDVRAKKRDLAWNEPVHLQPGDVKGPIHCPMACNGGPWTKAVIDSKEINFFKPIDGKEKWKLPHLAWPFEAKPFYTVSGWSRVWIGRG